MISVQFIENNTVAKIDELKGRTDDATRKGIMQSQIHLQRMITKNLSSGKFNIKSRHGGLSSSIAIAPVVKSGTGLVGIVGSNLKYARIQEVGGDIFPVKARVLKFQIGGKWISSKHVRIPPHFYMMSTLADEKDNIFQIIKNAQGEAINVKA